MVHLLQRHALAIKAQLAALLVLAYALPSEVLEPLLGPGLKLDTYGEFGFLQSLWWRPKLCDPRSCPQV